MGEMVKGSVIFQGTDRILRSSHRLCASCCPSSSIVIHTLSNISSLVGLRHTRIFSAAEFTIYKTLGLSLNLKFCVFSAESNSLYTDRKYLFYRSQPTDNLEKFLLLIHPL